MKHKGYNTVTTPNGNSTAQKFKYNGIEFEDVTGYYEMDVRAYDPAIARWTGIDPVTHHSMSPYTAFDNNPVFWADPSGADGESLGAAMLGIGNITQEIVQNSAFGNANISTSISIASDASSEGQAQNQTNPTDPATLPADPNKLNPDVWGDGSFKPDGVPDGKGHSKYWSHKDGNTILAWDEEGQHYHAYQNNNGRLGKRLQANGEVAGYIKNGKKVYRKGAPNAHLKPGTKLSFLSRNISKTNVFVQIFGLVPLILDSPQSPLYIFHSPGQGNPNRAYSDILTGQIYEWSNFSKGIREIRFYQDYEKRNGKWRGTGLIFKQYFDDNGNRTFFKSQ